MYKIIIGFLGSIQEDLRTRDLCGISEYLRKIKNSFGITDIRRVISHAAAVTIPRVAIEALVDSFFRTEAAKLLEPEVNAGMSNGVEEPPMSCEGFLREGGQKIAGYRAQYTKDVEYYEGKLTKLGLELVR